MKKNYTSNLFVILFSVFALNSFAQSTSSFWNKTTKEKLSKEERVLRKSEPKSAQFYVLNIDELNNHLADASKKNGEERLKNLSIFQQLMILLRHLVLWKPLLWKNHYKTNT